MRKRTYSSNDNNAIMISVEQLQERLNCGYKTAVTIGKNAKVRVSVGRRVFYNVKLIEKYVDKLAM